LAHNKRYVRNKYLSLVQQKTALLASYSGAKCIIENTTLIWSAEVKPTPNSRDYHMVLSYRFWERPSVYISGDSLRKLDAIDFPHKYSVDVEKKLVEICLYRYKEFTGYNYLSKTIVPWAIEWLFVTIQSPQAT